MDVINGIAGLPLCGSSPVVGLSDCGATPGAENFVTVYEIVIVDSSSATAENLDPVPNTLIINESESSGDPTNPTTTENLEPVPNIIINNGSGIKGGSTTWISLVVLSILLFVRRTKHPLN
jgi:hypothetical protein